MKFFDWWRSYTRVWLETIGLSRRELIVVAVISTGILFGGLLTLFRTDTSFISAPVVRDSLAILSEHLAFFADSLAHEQEKHRAYLSTRAIVRDSLYRGASTQKDSLGVQQLLQSMDSVAVVQGRIDTATVQTFASNMIRESVDVPTIGKNSRVKIFSGTMKPIDIRTASEAQLRLLPTIGSVTAKKIMMYRRAQMFEHTEDLMRVKGIGVKRFQKIQGYLLEF